jgi:hypothetical protein
MTAAYRFSNGRRFDGIKETSRRGLYRTSPLTGSLLLEPLIGTTDMYYPRLLNEDETTIRQESA